MTTHPKQVATLLQLALGLLGPGLFAALPAPAAAQPAEAPAAPPGGPAPKGWKATFPVEHKDISLSSAGVYSGGSVLVNLDSMSPLTVEPNETATWRVIPNPKQPTRGQAIFRDTVPGLRLNPNDPKEPIVREKGSLAAVATVNQEFGDVRMLVTVNTTGGPGGKGSSSRQGPMVRWNGKNQYLTCFVDFSQGTAYLFAARSAFEFIPIGTVPVKGFDNKKPYRIEFSMVGQKAHCRVFHQNQVVADTGEIQDSQTPARGISGVMIELAEKKPDVPLEGSFTEASSISI